jgi:hypothetical protein
MGIAQSAERYAEETERTLAGLVKFSELQWSIALSNIPIEVQDAYSFDSVRIVLCDDLPTYHKGLNKSIYWRHHFYPDYKAGRGEKPKLFTTATSSALTAAHKLKIPVLSGSYYEADDFIALLSKRFPEWLPDSKICGIHTVDTDLMQLVWESEERTVFWYNVGPWRPMLRNIQTSKQYWAKRWKREIEHPRDIAKDKASYGDKSDNLPPGTDLGLIDLINPKVEPEIDPRQLLAYPSVPLKVINQRLREFRIEAMLAGMPVRSSR